MTGKQLPLALRFPQGARFDSWAADGNEAALATLRAFAETPTAPGLFLCGPEGCGKTHLAMALAAATSEFALLPLDDLGAQAEPALAATAARRIVIVDDVDAIVARRDAEIALFDLFNRTRDAGGALLVTAKAPVSRLGLKLPDLSSRLASLSLLALQPLDDTARRRVIHARGAARGMEIGDDVLDFLFRRYPRDLGALMVLLERLDRETLARKRRLTVQLVRDVMREEPQRPS